MPDQFLLRYETRWALRWLGRPAGIFWLLFPAIYWLFKKGLGILPWDESPIGYLSSNIYMHSATIFLIVILTLWIWLLYRRTFVMLRPIRRQELVLTPMEGKHLWPGLLAAPVIVPVIILLVYWTLLLALPTLVDIARIFNEPRKMIDLAAGIVLMIVLFVFFFLLFVAATAYVANRCHMNPSLPHILVACIGFYFRFPLACWGAMLPIGACVYCGPLIPLNRALVVFLFFLSMLLFFVVFYVYLIMDASRHIKELRILTISEIDREWQIARERQTSR